ncbi:hypothetical protein HYH03_014000 [Edaphochlamys debaryana]|uniref:Protein kinase domain-containing protein n=1 Tax=Edaphochlamys debaryana TaxID=47281 RepID=A0A835XR42_9CHLO|nr:hypothetical protein HYH03_014000 [Edaphochlamys debaryana]|eukprot:KAG2487433.1 hypothetical protein HYH03_014000 [Edaphochlamys debaryana]
MLLWRCFGREAPARTAAPEPSFSKVTSDAAAAPASRASVSQLGQCLGPNALDEADAALCAALNKSACSPKHAGPPAPALKSAFSVADAREGTRPCVEYTSANDLVKDVQDLRWLGQGAQGVVYEGIWQGATVAVKFSIVQAECLDSIAYELLFSRLLCHPNVVQCYGAKVAVLDEATIRPHTPEAVHLTLRLPSGSPAIAAATAAGMLGRANGGGGGPTGTGNGSASSLARLPAGTASAYGLPAAIPPSSAATLQAAYTASTSGALVAGSASRCSTRTSADLTSVPGLAQGSSCLPQRTFTAGGSQVQSLQRGDSFHSDDGFGDPTDRKCTFADVRDVLATMGAKPGNYITQMILEHCDHGSLHAAIQRGIFRPSSRWGSKLALRALIRTAREVAQGMFHLHANNVLHGDLKPANVLLLNSRKDRRGYVAKVSDFGLSQFCTQEHISNAPWGTLVYMAPERLLEGQLCPASDVYSFGVILWEMHHGQRPYEGMHTAQIVMACAQGQGGARLEWGADANEEVARISRACMAHAPQDRPTFDWLMRELAALESRVRLTSAAPSLTPSRQNSRQSVDLPQLRRAPTTSSVHHAPVDPASAASSLAPSRRASHEAASASALIHANLGTGLGQNPPVALRHRASAELVRTSAGTSMARPMHRRAISRGPSMQSVTSPRMALVGENQALSLPANGFGAGVLRTAPASGSGMAPAALFGGGVDSTALIDCGGGGASTAAAVVAALAAQPGISGQVIAEVLARLQKLQVSQTVEELNGQPIPPPSPAVTGRPSLDHRRSECASALPSGPGGDADSVEALRSGPPPLPADIAATARPRPFRPLTSPPVKNPATANGNGTSNGDAEDGGATANGAGQPNGSMPYLPYLQLGPGEGAPGPLRPQLLRGCSDGVAAASDSQPASPAAVTKSAGRALTGSHLYGGAATSSALTGGAGTCGGVPTGGPITASSCLGSALLSSAVQLSGCNGSASMGSAETIWSAVAAAVGDLGVLSGPADGIDLGGSCGGGSCSLPPPTPGTPPMHLMGPGGPVQHPMQMQIQIPMQTPMQLQGIMQIQMAGGGGAAGLGSRRRGGAQAGPLRSGSCRPGDPCPTINEAEEPV